jgi:hypothetical protein
LPNQLGLTTFGAKVIPIFLLFRNLNIWSIPMRRKNGEVHPIPGGKLEFMMFGEIPQEITVVLNKMRDEDQSSQPFFMPFTGLFSKKELQRTLPRNGRTFIDGIYTFKVSLTRGIWRRVVLSAKHTMEDLHKVIIEAFSFDDDHLYSFFMDGRKWSDNCIASPYDDSGHLDASQVQIGGVGLEPKQRFLYLFDYGGEWSFTVEVDHVEEIDSVPFRPYKTEEKGAAPVQYGEY